MSDIKSKNKMKEKDIKEFLEHDGMKGMMTNGYVASDNALRLLMLNNPQLSCQAYILYLVLLAHRNTSTSECYPSRELLMKETGWCLRSIAKFLSELKDAGYIHIISGCNGKSNRYFFPYEDFYSQDEEDSYTQNSASASSTSGKPSKKAAGAKAVSATPSSTPIVVQSTPVVVQSTPIVIESAPIDDGFIF